MNIVYSVVTTISNFRVIWHNTDSTGWGLKCAEECPPASFHRKGPGLPGGPCWSLALCVTNRWRISRPALTLKIKSDTSWQRPESRSATAALPTAAGGRITSTPVCTPWSQQQARVWQWATPLCHPVLISTTIVSQHGAASSHTQAGRTIQEVW